MPEESYLYRFLNARETLDFYGRLFGLAPKVRKIDAPEADAVDLLAVTGSPITKRLAPVLGGVVLLLLLRWLLGGRGD